MFCLVGCELQFESGFRHLLLPRHRALVLTELLH